jgi:hypothetical protein
MPLGRERRQQQRVRASRNAAARPRTPAIDTFGTLKFPGEGDARGRLIEYEVDKYAFFTEGSPTTPLTFEVTNANIRGRVFTASLSEEQEVKFQKAGCGCETPYSLRGGRNKLLRDAGLDQPAEPASDTFMQQVLERESANGADGTV